jgi:UDPglucose 6-dehydrogenase
VDAAVPRATDHHNRALGPRLLERLGLRVDASTTVAILGLAYKPATPVLDESPSLQIAASLRAAGARVLGHDPLATEMDQDVLRTHLTVEPLERCLAQADVIVVATPDTAYRALTAEALLAGRRCATVVDCWRTLPSAVAADSRIRYIAIGRGLDQGR